jgi:hypothetical protein
MEKTHCADDSSGRVVVSRYSVSDGGIFWNTTPEIDDFPLLFTLSLNRACNSMTMRVPSLTHEHQLWSVATLGAIW